MKRQSETRPSVLFLATLIITLALVTAGSWSSSPVASTLAQAQPTATVYAIQTPPPVPGLNYPDTTADTYAPGTNALLPATPAVPANPGDPAGTGAPANDTGSVTTNLGGSDVAVTSEGGSYEIDAPKRRAKRMPRPTPQP